MSTWLAGCASIKFTPNEPLWLAGYAARTAPSQGTLSDLFVTALALRDAEGRTLLVASVDIIAIPVSLADAAAAIVRERYPEIPRENFVFAATHTHYGPEIRPDKVLFFKIPPEYAAKVPGTADMLARAVAEALVKAVEDLSPVRLYARRGTCGFAHNRRPHGDIVDHEVPILDVRRPDGSVKSVLFGYACHNTTMDPQDRLYSSDWAGHARRLLEDLRPGCTPVFVTGCGADQNPDPRGTQALSFQYGAELANAVDGALPAGPSDLGKEIVPALRVATEDVAFDMQPVTAEGIAEALASNDPPRRVKAQHLQDRLARGETLETSYPGPMQVVRLGDDVVMILMSGETVIDWAHKFKREIAPLLSGSAAVWVFGYCNDMYGYIPTRRVQQEGGYEGGRANLWSWLPSPWTGDVEERVTTTIHRLVRKVAEND
jgi:hypothetical protein